MWQIFHLNRELTKISWWWRTCFEYSLSQKNVLGYKTKTILISKILHSSFFIFFSGKSCLTVFANTWRHTQQERRYNASMPRTICSFMSMLEKYHAIFFVWKFNPTLFLQFQYLVNNSLSQLEPWLLTLFNYLLNMFEHVPFGKCFSIWLTKQFCWRGTSDHVWTCQFL